MIFHQVKDIQHNRDIGISNETIRTWVNGFRLVIASASGRRKDIREKLNSRQHHRYAASKFRKKAMNRYRYHEIVMADIPQLHRTGTNKICLQST